MWKIVELPFCAAYGEHADQHHILLTCPRAKEVWRLLNRTTVPYLQSFRNLWDMPELPDGDQRLRSAVITVILWNIWKARNNLHFNKTITPAREVLHASRKTCNFGLRGCRQAQAPRCSRSLDIVL
ncbi:hypothetical protein HU200_023700 [Digitaria exilis]|uniref:Reverse transcriptase zinc-binding domain-containing protein n=1 Tax=Digitaria exilis TaxID=1010633 RepID=A0A835BZI7_9POAL|nr:hypothetical protein HU200_023700 [Digitaria exilis]